MNMDLPLTMVGRWKDDLCHNVSGNPQAHLWFIPSATCFFQEWETWKRPVAWHGWEQRIFARRRGLFQIQCDWTRLRSPHAVLEQTQILCQRSISNIAVLSECDKDITEDNAIHVQTLHDISESHADRRTKVLRKISMKKKKTMKSEVKFTNKLSYIFPQQHNFTSIYFYRAFSLSRAIRFSFQTRFRKRSGRFRRDWTSWK